MRRFLKSLVCIPAMVALMAGCSSDTPSTTTADTVAVATDTADEATVETSLAEEPVTNATANETTATETTATETTATETAPAETAASETVPLTKVELAAPATFEMVAAVNGVWPNPVPKASVDITDIDKEALCAMLKDGGAFGSVTGEYYESKTIRSGDELSFTCKYRREATSPVELATFADVFVASALAAGEVADGTELDSMGIVTFTIAGKPLDPASSDFFDAGGRGCAAAGDAVGLPTGWRLESVGSVNDNQQIICRGPVPTPEVVTADAALVAKVVGPAGPPVD